MIISDDIEKLDRPFELVQFETDEQGRCVPRLTVSEFADDIHLYFEQRARELKRLHRELLDGEISPIQFFVAYQHMDIKDVAARVRLSQSTVRKHLTPEGFGDVKVGVLQRYARIFDVSVADFFQFTLLGAGVDARVSKHGDRLLQQLSVAAQAPEGE